MTDSIYIVQISFIGYQVLSTKITSNYDLSVDSIVSEKNTLLNSQPSASAASSGAACHVFRFMDFSTIYHLSIYLPIYPSINLSIIYLSTYLSIHPSIYLSIHLSIHPSIHPSIYLSISLYRNIYIYMHCICIMYVRLFQNKKLYATEQFVASASSGASSAGSASGVGGQPPYVDMVQTT